jgi:hypothetical protein
MQLDLETREVVCHFDASAVKVGDGSDQAKA